jgi:hypothetical protein
MVLLNEVWDNRRRGVGSAVVQAMSSAGTAMASIVATVALIWFAPYIVPVLAAALGSLRDAMMLGIVGALVSLLFVFFLPETVGRKFATVEKIGTAAG